jgi:hypothetical protein
MQSIVADLLAHQTTKLQEAEQELSLCNSIIDVYKAKEASLEAGLRTQVKTFLNVFGNVLVRSIKDKLTELYMNELTFFERLLFPYTGRNKSVTTPRSLYWVLDMHSLYDIAYVQSLSIDNISTLTRSNLVDAIKDLILACEFVDMKYYASQLEAIVQNEDDYEDIQKILNNKKELNERICSLNNVINILNNLPLTQTVTYQVTYDGSCSIK